MGYVIAAGQGTSKTACLCGLSHITIVCVSEPAHVCNGLKRGRKKEKEEEGVERAGKKWSEFGGGEE